MDVPTGRRSWRALRPQKPGQGERNGLTLQERGSLFGGPVSGVVCSGLQPAVLTRGLKTSTTCHLRAIGRSGGSVEPPTHAARYRYVLDLGFPWASAGNTCRGRHRRELDSLFSHRPGDFPKPSAAARGPANSIGASTTSASAPLTIFASSSKAPSFSLYSLIIGRSSRTPAGLFVMCQLHAGDVERGRVSFFATSRPCLQARRGTPLSCSTNFVMSRGRRSCPPFAFSRVTHFIVCLSAVRSS